ncbi:hypothetical protein ACLB2K_071455 [Fragaria x ananassa]
MAGVSVEVKVRIARNDDVLDTERFKRPKSKSQSPFVGILQSPSVAPRPLLVSFAHPTRFSGVIRCLPIMSFASKSRVSNGTSIRAESLPYRAEWWSTYGSGCPNMARLAVHILSQTCSLIQCKENQIPFDQLHKTRNSLEHQRLSDFVFLQVHKNKEHAYVDPISFENTGVVEDWVTEPEMYLENDENTDWKALDPPSYNSRLLELSVDEGEDLGSDLMITRFSLMDCKWLKKKAGHDVLKPKGQNS